MKSENKRVREIIIKFREHYNFEQSHVIKLSKMRQSQYNALELGKGNIDFDDTRIISLVYGLEVWDFINPKQKYPSISKLPPETKALAELRKDKVLLSKFDIPAEITKVLQSGKLNPEFTTTEVHALLPEIIRENIETSRVTDAFNKVLAPLVTKTDDKSGRNFLYVIKKK